MSSTFESGSGSAPPVGRLRWVAITAAFLNLGIHVYLMPMHLQEMFYIGVLFAIGSIALAVAIVGLATDRDHVRTLAWLLGAGTSLIMLIAFVLSRTVGLPGGYLETWAQSPEDILGLISLGLELAFVACCAASITTHNRIVAKATTPAGWPRLHDRTAPLA